MSDGVFKYQTGRGPRWGVRLKFKDADEIWRAKTWRGFTALRDARAFCDTKRADRYRQKWFPGTPAEQTVRDYFKHWLETYAAPSCKYSTYTSYTRVLNRYLLPALGHLPLRTLSATDLKTLLTTAHGKRRQTIRNIFTPIREGLAHAVADGLIPTNPALALGPHLRQLRDAKAQVHPFTPAQTTRLLAAATKQDPVLSAALHLGVRAGLRAGEILGLHWADLDLPHKAATIRHAHVWRRDTTTKNKQLRVVHLTPSLVAALRRLPRDPENPLALQRRGKGLSQEWLAKHYHALLEAIGLPRRRLHDLRHTYASHLIAIGASPKYIQTQMGHSTIAVTMDVYGHLYPDERTVDRLEPKRTRAAR